MTNVTKDLEMERPSWTVEMGSPDITSVFIRESQERSHTHTGEVPREDRGTDELCGHSQEMPSHQRLEEARIRFSLRITRGTAALPHLDVNPVMLISYFRPPEL